VLIQRQDQVRVRRLGDRYRADAGALTL
jgi:hypothetical protein